MVQLGDLPSRIMHGFHSTPRVLHFLWRASWLQKAERLFAQEQNITLYKLMQSAGYASFLFLETLVVSGTTRFVILCGTGNNGGDGFEIASLFAKKGRDVTVVVIHPSKPYPPEAAAAKEELLKHVEKGEVHLLSATEWLEKGVLESDMIVVDALLGIGASGAPRGEYAQLINRVNESPARCVAIDVPSGLNAETGMVEGACMRASDTVTFICAKTGLVTGRARDFVGTLHYAPLSADSWMGRETVLREAQCYHLTHADLHELISRPPGCAHKGSNGKILIIGGDLSYGGAAIMSAEAALRTGAGLIRVLTRREHTCPLLSRCPEVMVEEFSEGGLDKALDWCTSYAVGPGLGQDDWGYAVYKAVSKYSRENPQKPSVWDADALNLLATHHYPSLGKEEGHLPQLRNAILTPHPGEASRLLGKSIDEVERDRFLSARNLTEKFGGVALLKGPGTVIHVSKDLDPITIPIGNSPIVPLRCAVTNVGNAGMATGGMGDILTGTIVTFLAQKLPSWQAACAGCVVHGAAADLAVKVRGGEKGLRTTEVLQYYANAVNPHLR